MKRSPVLLTRHAYTVVLFLLAALALSLAASAACENILVSGAGYAPVNGTYARGGDAYGKPTYDLGGVYRITWMGMWYLADFGGGTYYQNDSSAAEPPSTGWVSCSGYAPPAPILSCADVAPIPEQRAPEPKIVGRSYEVQDGSLTLTFKNVGNAPATVFELCAGPGLTAQGGEGWISFWIPDSDLLLVVPLEQTYSIDPGRTLTLILPTIQLPQDWVRAAAVRSALFTGFTFGAPHVAVGVNGSATSWIHLLPAWLEAVEAPGG